MSDSGIRVLAFEEPSLSASAVETLERAVRETRDNLPLVLDCARLRDVTPAGLSALLELGRNATGLRELSLVNLSRAITRVAIEAGLSERFAIYTSLEACERSFANKEPATCEP